MLSCNVHACLLDGKEEVVVMRHPDTVEQYIQLNTYKLIPITRLSSFVGLARVEDIPVAQKLFGDYHVPRSVRVIRGFGPS